MTKEDLKKITLDTPIFHPFLGRGYPTSITETSVNVKFTESTQVFSASFIVGDCTGLQHIFLKPVKVVEK